MQGMPCALRLLRCWCSLSITFATVPPTNNLRLKISRKVTTGIALTCLSSSVWSRGWQHCWELWIWSSCLASLQLPLIPPWAQLSILEEHVLAVCFFLHLYLLRYPLFLLSPDEYWEEKEIIILTECFSSSNCLALLHTIRNNNGAHWWAGQAARGWLEIAGLCWPLILVNYKLFYFYILFPTCPCGCWRCWLCLCDGDTLQGFLQVQL